MQNLSKLLPKFQNLMLMFEIFLWFFLWKRNQKTEKMSATKKKSPFFVAIGITPWSEWSTQKFKPQKVEKFVCEWWFISPDSALEERARFFAAPCNSWHKHRYFALSLLFTLFKKRCWSNSHFSLFLHCLKNLVSFLEKCFQKKILCLLY